MNSTAGRRTSDRLVTNSDLVIRAIVYNRRSNGSFAVSTKYS